MSRTQTPTFLQNPLHPKSATSHFTSHPANFPSWSFSIVKSNLKPRSLGSSFQLSLKALLSQWPLTHEVFSQPLIQVRSFLSSQKPSVSADSIYQLIYKCVPGNVLGRKDPKVKNCSCYTTVILIHAFVLPQVYHNMNEDPHGDYWLFAVSLYTHLDIPCSPIGLLMTCCYIE